MNLDEIEVVNVTKYIREHKLNFRPDTLMLFVWKQDLLTDLDENIDTTDESQDKCQACWKMREFHKSNTSLCKKHRAIHEWENNIDKKKIGYGTLQGRRFAIFSNYVVFENPEDPEHLYLIWYGTCARKNHVTYRVNVDSFKGIFDETGHDITNLLDPNLVLLNGNWQVYYPDENDLPILETIRY